MSNQNLSQQPQNQERATTPLCVSHREQMRNKYEKFLLTPFAFEDTITDEMVERFKAQQPYSAPPSSNPLFGRAECPSDRRCVHQTREDNPFHWPFLCERFMGGKDHPRRKYVSIYKNHHQLFMKRLRRKIRILFRAFSRTEPPFELMTLFINSLGEYLYWGAYQLDFPIDFRKWIIRQYHPWRFRPSQKARITMLNFNKYYLYPFLFEFDTLVWDSSIKFFVDSKEVGKDYTTSEMIDHMISYLVHIPAFKFGHITHHPFPARRLQSQMDAPSYLKDIRKKRSPRKFAKLDHATRQLAKQADRKIQIARDNKTRISNNEGVDSRLYSQMDSEIPSTADPFSAADLNDPIPLQTVRDEVAALLDLSPDELEVEFRRTLEDTVEDFVDATEPNSEDVPGLLAQLYGYMTKAKTTVVDTAQWLADNIISIQEFLSKLWKAVSAGLTIVTKTLDWFIGTEDVWYIPKLLVLFLIYVVGYSVGCSTIARLLAAVYSAFVFTGPMSWIPSLLALATANSDRIYSQSNPDLMSDSLLTTSVSLLAASLFGQLCSLNIDRRSGFFATMDTVSRGINGTMNIGEKLTLLFKKAVGYFGLEKYGFAPDLESAYPQDFEDLVKDVQHFSCASVVRALNTNPEDCRRAENMRKNLMQQQVKYAKSPPIRTKLSAFTPFIHKIADIARLRDPAHTKIRTEPVCVYLYGDPGVGKSIAMNLIASAVLAKHGFIPADATAAVVSKAIAENFYVRNSDEEFWNGYHNQFIAAEDDALQTKDSEANPSKQPTEFIKISNAFPYPLNMAELEDKGTTYFQSALYMASTNLKIINPPSITSQEAYLRRITIPLYVCVKPEKRDPNGRLKKNEDLVGYDLDAYNFYLHDFRTGVTSGVDAQGRQDSTKAMSLKQVCDLINSRLEKKKNEAVLLEDACTTFARLYSQAGNRTLVSVKDMNINISQDAVKMIENYIHCGTDTRTVTNGLSCWTYTHPHDSFIDMLNYFVHKKEGTPMCQIVFNPNEHVSNIVQVRKWMAETKKKYQGWLSTVNWKRILTFMGYATTLAAVSAFAGQYTYNRVQKSIAPPAETELQKAFDREAQQKGIFRSSIEQAQAFTQGSHHIPYRYDEPLPFSWFTKKPRFGVFNDQEECDLFYNARDIFTTEWGDKDILAKFTPGDFLPTAYYLTWVSPEAAVREGVLTQEEADGYQQVLTRWNAKQDQMLSMSGKSRQKVRSPPGARKHPQPLARGMQSHIGNKNADDILTKVQNNQATLWQGRANNNLLFFEKRKFLFNYHAYRIFLENSTDQPFVTLMLKTASEGTQVAFKEIKWTKVADRLSDVIIGEMPRHVCPEFRSLTHAFITKKEADRLPFKQAIMSVPGPNGFTMRTGQIRSLLTEEIEDPLGPYRVYGVELSVVSRRGDCGSPYILDTADSHRLFAIHTAGNESLVKSVGTLVYQEMLTSTSQSGSTSILHGNVLDLGHLPPVFSNTKSQIVPTAIFGKIVETQMAPAKLARFDEDGGPMAKALSKQFGPVYHVDPTTLHYASRSYMRMLNKCAPPEELGVLSFRRATRGDEGSDFIRPINRTRSAGYPFVLHTKQKGKTQWFPEDWSENTHTRALEELVNSQISAMEKGEVQQYVFLDTLKDETRPIAKVLEGKTRVFAAAPMDFIIVFRMYFLTFLAHMMRNRIDNESAVGIKAQSDEWTLLYHRLIKHGPRVIAGDFSNYDGSLNPRILWAVYDIIEHFYASAGATEPEQQVRRCLWSNIVNSYHLCGDIFYQLNHSQPSGNPSTAILNSMYNSIACRYVFYRLYEPSVEFNDYVSMIAYGDDNVLNPSALVPLYNQDNMAEIFSEIGMTYTDEDKTGDLGDKTIDQVGFLKRKFAYDEEMRFCYAPLSLTSILECFNWTKKSDYELDIIVQNANSAYVELAMHPKPVFNYWSRRIANAISEGYHHQNLPITNWSGYRMEIRTGFAIDNIAELDWS